jgi:hypothetical protein
MTLYRWVQNAIIEEVGDRNVIEIINIRSMVLKSFTLKFIGSQN